MKKFLFIFLSFIICSILYSSYFFIFGYNNSNERLPIDWYYTDQKHSLNLTIIKLQTSLAH